MSQNEDKGSYTIYTTQEITHAQFKVSRDWFVERFKYIIDDVLTDVEKRDRQAMRIRFQYNMESDTERLTQVLIRGIQVCSSDLFYQCACSSNSEY